MEARHGIRRGADSAARARGSRVDRSAQSHDGRPHDPLPRRARSHRGRDVTASEERAPLPLIAIYADESCLGNGRDGDNPGGAAGVIEYWNPATERLSRYDYWISEPATTNNRMALRSAIEAFQIVSRKGSKFRALFTSDSQYL